MAATSSGPPSDVLGKRRYEKHRPKKVTQSAADNGARRLRRGCNAPSTIPGGSRR